MEQYKDEIWRPIKGYEGLYEISNYGRVKSLKCHKERLRTPTKRNKDYLGVSLCKNGKQETKLVHRLVAEAFIPNPDNLPCVNHKDENPTNNVIDNIEWCSYKYNDLYGTRNERILQTKKMKKCCNAEKPVLQYTLDGEFVAEYKSILDAARLTSTSKQIISYCCNNQIKKRKGFIWKFK